MYLVDPVYILYLLYFLLQGVIPLLLIKLVKVGKIKINENVPIEIFVGGDYKENKLVFHVSEDDSEIIRKYL